MDPAAATDKNAMLREGHPLESQSAATGAMHAVPEVGMGTSQLGLWMGALCCPFTLACSWWTLNPREEALVITYGVLEDHVTTPGCHFHNCFGREIRTISTQVCSVELTNQQVTDKVGNPILAGGIITYRVTSARDALLNTDNVAKFVVSQASASLKQTLAHFTYEQIRGESDEVQRVLRATLQPRVDVAGVTIASVNINELNYHPAIAQAMLRKQAAAATLEARQLIVTGATTMALAAMKTLEEQGVQLTEPERSRMAGNLLVVLVGDRDPTPTISLA